jgi:hypothetical protein
MMSVGNEVLLSTVMVTAGSLANGHGISARTIVGGSFLGVGILALDAVNSPLAQKIGLLILITAAFLNVPTIAYKLGLIKTKPDPWEWDGISRIVSS